MENKICTKCKEIKDITLFYKTKRLKSGYCSRCKSCNDNPAKELRQKNRKQVIEFYSKGKNSCEICSENRYDCLDLDHIDGGGTRDRRRLKGPYSNRLHRELIIKGFPEGFRVLCRNCNWIEWINQGKKRFNK